MKTQAISNQIKFKCLPGIIWILSILMLGLTSNSQNFPQGFSQVKVATVYYPTSMDFAPDGRIFCAEKDGKVKIVKNGTILGTPFLNISVNAEDERGLSGIVLDPDFSSNHYVYIYYTTSSGSVHNRLSRFVANGDVAMQGSETVLFDFAPSVNTIHNGGGMVFGNDGKLYLCIGNDNVNSNSQNIDNYKGKVIRINKDGSVPEGNPFSGSEAANRVWAYGLRNPWTIALQQSTGKIYVIDVGESAFEEINDCSSGGKNFGWPGAEGNSNNPSYSNPVYAYPHGNGLSAGCAITGGDFFKSGASNYPSEYNGKYFFIDYCNDWINYLDLSSGVTKHNFASNLPGGNNYIRQGKDGNLYYYSISQNSLFKIVYNGGNAPVISGQPNSATVSAGNNVSFYVTATGAPPITYQWQKNGDNIPGTNAATLTITNAQNSDEATYKVIVSNSHGSVSSSTVTLKVTGFNAKPQATILTPTAGTLYRGGDIISFSGTATDEEDGELPASAYKWFVQFIHESHVHPGPVMPQEVKSGTFAIPASGEKSAQVKYRVYLVVSDAQDVVDTVFRDIEPRTSRITLQSIPPNLKVLFNDQPETSTYTTMVVSGIQHGIGIVSPQNAHDSDYFFEKWMHGGSNTQTLSATDDDQTFTAMYKTNMVPTAQEEFNFSEKFIHVFPNPTTGLFTFDLCLDNASASVLTLNIFNLNGIRVYERPPSRASGCIIETIQMPGGLPEGIYVLKLGLDFKTETIRLVLAGR
jgi:glucose/arabinose dehydrogenase